MGSIISAVECPNCEGQALEDLYYKSQEVYIHCAICGYDYAFELVFDEKTRKAVQDEDGLYVYKTELIDKPLGCLHASFKRGGHFTPIQSDIQLKDMVNRYKDFYANPPVPEPGDEPIELVSLHSTKVECGIVITKDYLNGKTKIEPLIKFDDSSQA